MFNKRDISIILAGEAGQGIQTVEYIITRVLKQSGYHVFSTREFMSRIRGGVNSTEIRVASYPVSSFVERIDILVPFNRDALKRLGKRISPKTSILGEQGTFAGLPGRKNNIEIPFTEIASEIGGAIYANTVAVGVLSGLLQVEFEILGAFLKGHFARKGEDIVRKNIEAAVKGYDIGSKLFPSITADSTVRKNERIHDDILVDGAEALALGAIAGGCNFLSFYPMSPATSVAAYLAGYASEFDLVVEQAEDEISAMNMVIGAWYAGARGLVSTSGGGFALMVEGLSLAGMTEMPVVIHVGQRPGPATGLPTRTEQADFEFVLKAGHGEFPRVILSPGKLEDIFYLTQSAFNIADKYQIPVFILTDQFLLDSSYHVSPFNIANIKVEKYITKTAKNYARYKVTRDGISARGIPGYGTGVVVVDSDEHDEQGHITEDSNVRVEMVDKRLQKLDLARKEAIQPELVGARTYDTLLVGWGSTYAPVKEALQRVARKNIAFLHFKQVYPLAAETSKYLQKAKQLIAVENNANAQFANVIRANTGYSIDKKILKYNGLPFSVEEIVRGLEKITV